MYDLVIKNGTVYDGTGEAGFIADVALEDGKIAQIGQGLEGERVIDARGLAVTPGFIDSHSHSDKQILAVPAMTQKAEQGITTCVAGLCGTTFAPVAPDHKDYALYRDMPTFLFEHGARVPQGVNTVCYSGHLALRRAVMGMDDRPPTAQEQQKMEDLLRRELEGGTVGISFGLIYAPGSFARKEELAGLCAVAKQYDAVAAFHIRSEGDDLLEAVQEMIDIALETGVRTVLSHHKAMGKANWGKVKKTLAMIDEANSRGGDIYCDMYPYTASSTTLAARFLPKEFFDGGLAMAIQRLQEPALRQAARERNIAMYGQDLSWVLVTHCPAYPQYAGKYLDEVAKLHGKDGYETVFDMICHSQSGCGACFFLVHEEDVQTVLRHPRTMIGTDSGVTGNSKGVFHPRMLGTFPRVLGRYVREMGVVTLPEMIRRITSLPAQVYHLSEKGLLKPGYDGDICIFDPDTILDLADYTDCHKKNRGVRYVLINGQIAVENNLQTPDRPGKLLPIQR